MIEVLVAIVVSVVGMLGLIGLQARAWQAEAESFQRSQALIVLDDIAARLRANGTRAAEYVASGIGAGVPGDCSTAPAEGTADTVRRDLCEIAATLNGTAAAAGQGTGALTQGRACIVETASDTYVVAVAWAGLVPSGAPASSCGKGEYGDEALRRVVSTILVVPELGA